MSVRQLKYQSPSPIAIVGAGVLGALVAEALTRLKLPVVVLEAKVPGAGATGSTVPWVNASGKRPKSYFDLCVQAMSLWRDLAAQLAGDWYVETGNLHWTDDEGWHNTLMGRAEEASTWGYDSRWLTPAEAHALEPGIDLGMSVGPVLFYAQEGLLRPRSMLRAMRESTMGNGARWSVGTAVTDLGVSDGRVHEVVLDTGERLAVDGLVICAGLETNAVLGLIGESVPMIEFDDLGRVTTLEHTPYKTVHGLLVEVAENPTGLRRILHAPGITIMPAESGGLLLHSMAANAAVTLETPMDPPPAPVEDVLTLAVKALPQLAGAKVKDVRLGCRPIPLDGMPLVGRIPSTENAHVLVSHSAISTAPALVRLFIDSLVAGAPVPSEFDIARFRDGEGLPRPRHGLG